MKRRKNETRLKEKKIKKIYLKTILIRLRKNKLSKAPCVIHRSLAGGGGVFFQHDQLIPVCFLYGHEFKSAGDFKLLA